MPESFSRRINIYVDAGDAQAAYKRLADTQQKLNAEVKKYTDAGKEVPTKVTKQLNEVTSALDRQSKKLSGELTPSYKELSGTVTRLTRELKNMSEQDPGFKEKTRQLAEAKAALNGYGESLFKVRGGLKEMLSSAKGVAFGVLIGNWATAAMQTLQSVVSGIFSVSSQFEASVKNLSAITGALGSDLEYLQNAAVKLASTGSRSAVEYVEAMKFIASAKPELLKDKEALVEVTKAAALLARASGLELPDASKRLTDALNQYGAPAREAVKYVDALAAAAKYGAAEVPEITEALLQFGPIAKQSNISIYESAAAIELLAEKGIKGAEAGTKLRNIFLTLQAVDALPKEAIAQLQKAGVNTQILSDKSLSLAVRLREMSKASGDATAMVQIFDKQNVSAATNILTNLPRFEELAEQVKETGVAADQAATNTGTLSGAWNKLMNSFATLATGFGVDWLKKIVSGLSDAVIWMGKFTGLIKSSAEALRTEQQELLLAEARITQYNEGNETRTKLIRELQEKYPEYLANLDAEKASNQEVSEAIALVNNQLLKKIVLAQLQERLEDAAKSRSKTEIELADRKLKIEKEIAYLLNSRSAAANKANKTELEGIDIMQQAALLLRGDIKLQEVSKVSLNDLGNYVADYNAQLNKRNEAVDEYNKVLAEQLKLEQTIKQNLGITDGGTTAPEAAGAPGGTATVKQKEEIDKFNQWVRQTRIDLRLNEMDEFNRSVELVRQKYLKIKQEHGLLVEDETQLTEKQIGMLAQVRELEAQELNQVMTKFAAMIKGADDVQTKLTQSAGLAIIELGTLTKNTEQIILSSLATVEQEISGLVQNFGTALGYVQSAFNAMNAMEDNRLASLKAKHTKERKNYDQMLRDKRISQYEYGQKVSELEAEFDQKKKELELKQWQRQKAMRVAQVLMAIPQAAFDAFRWGMSIGGPILAGVLAALATGIGFANLAAVASAPPPQYEQGGPVGGRLHRDGGTLIEAEKGEFIVKNGPSQRYRPFLEAINSEPRSLSVSRTSDNIYAMGGEVSSNPTAREGIGLNEVSIIELGKKIDNLGSAIKTMGDKKVLFVQRDYELATERWDLLYKKQL